MSLGRFAGFQILFVVAFLVVFSAIAYWKMEGAGLALLAWYAPVIFTVVVAAVAVVTFVRSRSKRTKHVKIDAQRPSSK